MSRPAVYVASAWEDFERTRRVQAAIRAMGGRITCAALAAAQVETDEAAAPAAWIALAVDAIATEVLP